MIFGNYFFIEFLPVDFFFIKLSQTYPFHTTQALCSNFVDRESFLKSNSPDILALFETNLDDSIDSGNFSVRSYLPLIQNISTTHMLGLIVYYEEVLPLKHGP